ncbi:glycoside hydrolase family 19 protein [Denitromonas halophila]|uniref:Glycoside hydrolase family 19 protein n=1 Tax=Denitromonas halophila TaxID=1629404 RepID=A0A557QLR5_9RHOO|nr:glycoside hydrolase family 19 protein [Denitromonas halophila]TVO53845.1 glycoside hydrolase family 19 protein [Denitromonas halophila]
MAIDATTPTITPALLVAAVGCTRSAADTYCAPLAATARRYAIDTPARLAAFLAQIGHESGSFRYASELWGPTDAQRRYEGRAELGNIEPGDGSRFRGRGLIQITGRHNYTQLATSLGIDCVAQPELLETPRFAALCAGWYWHTHNLNALADAGQFDTITRRINGGTNGAADRNARHARALAALKQQPAPVVEATPTPVTEIEPMPAFALAALPALIQAAPDLIRIFGGKKSEQNAQAAEVVAKIAMEATSENTAEGAARAIAENPQDADAFRAGVRMQMGDLLMLIEADEKSRTAAMDRNAQLMATDPRWLYIIGGIAVLVVVASYILAGIVITGEGFSNEVKAMVITGVVIGSIGTVLAFLFGSSHGSRVKDSRQ